MGGDPYAGWIPLFLRGSRAEVEWGYMGDERFTDPFCHETLQKLASKPFNQMFRRKCGLDSLLSRTRGSPGLPLRGIVFHMSRCGSTLAAQWLAALPDSVVLSEPEPLGTLLQWSPPDADEALLRALLAAMGQPRRDSDRSLFLKADCIHLLHIDRLLRAFPGTPWIFMYRHPVEVLVSHRRKPVWIQMLETMGACGLYPPAEFALDPEDSVAWILSIVMRQARHAMTRHGNGLLLNYSELPQALETMAGHFGVDLAGADRAALRDVSWRDAKQRGETFRPDSAEKRAAADPRILRLAARWLEEPYRDLEHLRLGVIPGVQG